MALTVEISVSEVRQAWMSKSNGNTHLRKCLDVSIIFFKTKTPYKIYVFRKRNYRYLKRKACAVSVFFFKKEKQGQHEHIDQKSIQLSAMDVLAPTTMKNAAKCDT